MEAQKHREMLESLNAQRLKEGLPPLGELPGREGAPPRRARAAPRGMPPKLTGTRIVRPPRPKPPPRNKPCPCGSGRKWKKCCGAPERLRPRVQAVRSLPGDIVAPGRGASVASDGLPLIATPRDFDPAGNKDIVTAEDIEREFDKMVKKTMEEAEGAPLGELVIAKR